MMYWLGYILALLATVVAGWALPLVGVAILLPLLQIVYALQPFVAAGVMGLLGGLLVWYSVTRQAWWRSVFWGALWGMGALTAALGVFHWYALFLECVLVILLLIPGVVATGWAYLLRWYAAWEIGLTLLLLWRQVQGVPGVTLVMVLLLLGFATLLGAGAYRPFEARRLRRRAAALVTIGALAILLWRPVFIPVSQWVGQAAGSVGRAVATSPIGRWYHATALQWERRELGEAVKTEALRQLQRSLTEAHKARWEKAVGEIPNLPLTPREWEDLGISRRRDP
jgi:hypothetical protein